MTSNIKSVLLALGASFVAFQAGAQTYSNQSFLNGSGYGELGGGRFTSFGQTFELGETKRLDDWTFYPLAGSAGNVKLLISRWDSQRVVGPVIYESAPIHYAGPYYGQLKFSSINTILADSSYIAFLSVSGVDSPLTDMSVQATTSSNGGLNGRFFYSSTFNPQLPDASNNVWHGDSSYASLGFTAKFSPVSAVDEPNPFALLMLGLSAVGYVMRKKSVG
ncbi:hypothetical protein [Roseateles albus]|uniref:PEP-CTERM protein-sorting domain-containing protein n=1 Tax=Roseateles albus TaxID=2987525 RepID=A0ABT5KEV7_9BURK|nr:hypothetical protein [Roseateles albus]MDC8772458.1 hypothetical protein [Roseateles albus]